jgi:hypothetical protein
MPPLKKTFLLIICLWAFGHSAVAQNQTSDTKKFPFKLFYTVEANFGISTTSEIKYNLVKSPPAYFGGIEIEDENAKLAYKTLAYGIDFSVGMELKYYFKVGLGLGYLYYKQSDKGLPYTCLGIDRRYGCLPNFRTTHGIPLYLFIQSNFLDRKNSPFINLKVGNNFLVTKEAVNIFSDEQQWLVANYGKFRLKNGLFLASNIGVACKMKQKGTLNVSIGYRYMSRPYDLLQEYDALKYRKTGYTIVDHHFIVSMGVTF